MACSLAPVPAAAIDHGDDLARRVARALQRGRVGVGQRRGVQWRVHVAGIDSQDADAVGAQLLVPDAAQVQQGRLAGTVGAPARVRGHGRVARDVDNERARSGRGLAGRCSQQAEQRLGQAERSEQVGLQRDFEVLALGVAEQGERHRPEARGVVDEHVEAAERAADLQGDGVRVGLLRDVADDAVAAGKRRRGAGDGSALAGDEGDAIAARRKGLGERAAEARGAAGDGDAQRRAREVGMVAHDRVLKLAMR